MSFVVIPPLKDNLKQNNEEDWNGGGVRVDRRDGLNLTYYHNKNKVHIGVFFKLIKET